MVCNVVFVIAPTFHGVIDAVYSCVAHIMSYSPICFYHTFHYNTVVFIMLSQKVNGIIELTLKGEENESEDSTNLNLDKKEG